VQSDSRRKPAVGHVQVEFATAIEADPICPVLDGEHSTQMAMVAPKGKFENPKQGVRHS
jgi:hypothetical protein